jgi:transposase
MGKQSKIEIKESLSELQILQKKQKNLKSEKRIKCLILLKENKFATQTQIADYLGVCRQSIVKWLTSYRKDGIEGIQLKMTRNKKSKIITSQIHEGLSEKLKDSKNPLRGYWDAVIWVEQQYGVKVNYAWLRKYMIKYFKTKLKAPRKSHYKKDKKATANFLKLT